MERGSKMKKFSLLMALVLTLSITSHVTNVVYAADLNSKSFELIEDDGEPYEEEIIYFNPLLRASGTYKSTYDMTGGVYSSTTWKCSSGPSFKVTISPTYFEIDDAHVNMTVYLEKKEIYGWNPVDQGDVTLLKGGTVNLSGNSSGTYRLYFRNWSGFQAKGKINVSYSY